MNKTRTNSIRTISEIGIFAALGYVLDELQGAVSKGVFINGGSIGFAMIAVIIIAYRRGWLPALLTGLIMGLLDIATSAYILHPLQLLLDYILPYGVVGLVGFLKPMFDRSQTRKEKILWLISGAVIGGLLKFTSHYLAGIFFWKDAANFAWGLNDMNLYLYCFVYNIAFIGPSIILTAALLVAMQIKAPKVISENQIIIQRVELESERDPFSFGESGFYIVLGGFCFVYFLIQYIQSFYDYNDADTGAYGYEFNADSMLIFILGFMLLILGINCLIATIRERHSYKLSLGGFITISTISFIYCLARLIRTYSKSKDPTTYWIWFGFGLFTLATAIAILLIRIYRDKKKGD